MYPATRTQHARDTLHRQAFDPIHPKDIIQTLLPPSVCKGIVEEQLPGVSKEAALASLTADERRVLEMHKRKPYVRVCARAISDCYREHVLCADRHAYLKHRFTRIYIHHSILFPARSTKS